MKVYQAIRDVPPKKTDISQYLLKGDLVCERLKEYVGNRIFLEKNEVEENPDLFKLLFDDAHGNPNYYIRPIYTQYDMDKVKNNQ